MYDAAHACAFGILCHLSADVVPRGNGDVRRCDRFPDRTGELYTARRRFGGPGGHCVVVLRES